VGVKLLPIPEYDGFRICLAAVENTSVLDSEEGGAFGSAVIRQHSTKSSRRRENCICILYERDKLGKIGLIALWDTNFSAQCLGVVMVVILIHAAR
jgi:hypothetical protein